MRESILQYACIYCVFSDYMLNCDTWNNQYSVNGARGDDGIDVAYKGMIAEAVKYFRALRAFYCQF